MVFILFSVICIKYKTINTITIVALNCNIPCKTLSCEEKDIYILIAIRLI